MGYTEAAMGRIEPTGRNRKARARRAGWAAWWDQYESDEGPLSMGEENYRRLGGDPGLFVARDRAQDRAKERNRMMDKGRMSMMEKAVISMLMISMLMGMMVGLSIGHVQQGNWLTLATICTAFAVAAVGTYGVLLWSRKRCSFGCTLGAVSARRTDGTKSRAEIARMSMMEKAVISMLMINMLMGMMVGLSIGHVQQGNWLTLATICTAFAVAAVGTYGVLRKRCSFGCTLGAVSARRTDGTKS